MPHNGTFIGPGVVSDPNTLIIGPAEPADRVHSFDIDDDSSSSDDDSSSD